MFKAPRPIVGALLNTARRAVARELRRSSRRQGPPLARHSDDRREEESRPLRFFALRAQNDVGGSTSLSLALRQLLPKGGAKRMHCRDSSSRRQGPPLARPRCPPSMGESVMSKANDERGGATQFSLNRAVHGEQRRDRSGGLRDGPCGGPCRPRGRRGWGVPIPSP